MTPGEILIQKIHDAAKIPREKFEEKMQFISAAQEEFRLAFENDRKEQLKKMGEHRITHYGKI